MIGRVLTLATLLFTMQDLTPEQLLPPAAVPIYRNLTATVAKHGWACVAVGGKASHGGFAYTMGLSSKDLPELLFDGDSTEAACGALNEAAERLIARHRPPHDGETIAERNGVRLVVRQIYTDEFFAKCVFAAVWRDTHHLSATGMQVLALAKGETMPP